MRKERRKKKKAAAAVEVEAEAEAVKSGGGLVGDSEPAAAGDRSETKTQNSSSSSSSSSSSCYEDEPICFFLSTTSFESFEEKNYNNKKVERSSPCKWYVLESESGGDATSRGGGGGGSFDDDEGGLCPILLEKQISFEFETTININDDDGTTESEKKKSISSCRLIQVDSFPSSLPHDHEHPTANYKVFVFESRIYILGGMEISPSQNLYECRYFKDVYHFDTRFFPYHHHHYNGWRKAPDMLSSRYNIAAASAGSKIYLMGVVDKPRGFSPPFGEVLDPKLDHHRRRHFNCNWSRELAPLPSCLEDAGKIQVVGVLDFGKKILLYSLYSERLFYYDIECNAWFVVANNFGSWLGRITVALGCVFCFGQFNGFDLDTSLAAYDLATRSWLPVEGLIWDGDMMPLRDVYPASANLFHINHNKLAFVWTQSLPGINPRPVFQTRISLHCSKFFIHKTANCIRASHPSFCLSATIRYTGRLSVCMPLNSKCFGLRDLEYYEEEIGSRELMLGDAMKECSKTVLTMERISGQRMSSDMENLEQSNRASVGLH